MASRVVIDWLMAGEKLLVTSPQDSCMSLIENPVVVKYLTAIRCPLQDFQLFAACQLVSNHRPLLGFQVLARGPRGSPRPRARRYISGSRRTTEPRLLSQAFCSRRSAAMRKMLIFFTFDNILTHGQSRPLRVALWPQADAATICLHQA